MYSHTIVCGNYNRLRDTVSGSARPLDASESGVAQIKRYIGQLKSATRRFPIHAGQKWNGVNPAPM